MALTRGFGAPLPAGSPSVITRGVPLQGGVTADVIAQAPVYQPAPVYQQPLQGVAQSVQVNPYISVTGGAGGNAYATGGEANATAIAPAAAQAAPHRFIPQVFNPASAPPINMPGFAQLPGYSAPQMMASAQGQQMPQMQAPQVAAMQGVPLQGGISQRGAAPWNVSGGQGAPIQLPQQQKPQSIQIPGRLQPQPQQPQQLVAPLTKFQKFAQGKKNYLADMIEMTGHGTLGAQEQAENLAFERRLTEEDKRMRALIAAARANPSGGGGGGYDKYSSTKSPKMLVPPPPVTVPSLVGYPPEMNKVDTPAGYDGQPGMPFMQPKPFEMGSSTSGGDWIVDPRTGKEYRNGALDGKGGKLHMRTKSHGSIEDAIDDTTKPLYSRKSALPNVNKSATPDQKLEKARALRQEAEALEAEAGGVAPAANASAPATKEPTKEDVANIGNDPALDLQPQQVQGDPSAPNFAEPQTPQIAPEPSPDQALDPMRPAMPTPTLKEIGEHTALPIQGLEEKQQAVVAENNRLAAEQIAALKDSPNGRYVQKMQDRAAETYSDMEDLREQINELAPNVVAGQADAYAQQYVHGTKWAQVAAIMNGGSGTPASARYAYAKSQYMTSVLAQRKEMQTNYKNLTDQYKEELLAANTGVKELTTEAEKIRLGFHNQSIDQNKMFGGQTKAGVALATATISAQSKMQATQARIYDSQLRDLASQRTLQGRLKFAEIAQARLGLDTQKANMLYALKNQYNDLLASKNTIAANKVKGTIDVMLAKQKTNADRQAMQALNSTQMRNYIAAKAHYEQTRTGLTEYQQARQAAETQIKAWREARGWAEGIGNIFQGVGQAAQGIAGMLP